MEKKGNARAEGKKKAEKPADDKPRKTRAKAGSEVKKLRATKKIEADGEPKMSRSAKKAVADAPIAGPKIKAVAKRNNTESTAQKDIEVPVKKSRAAKNAVAEATDAGPQIKAVPKRAKTGRPIKKKDDYSGDKSMRDEPRTEDTGNVKALFAPLPKQQKDSPERTQRGPAKGGGHSDRGRNSHPAGQGNRPFRSDRDNRDSRPPRRTDDAPKGRLPGSDRPPRTDDRNSSFGPAKRDSNRSDRPPYRPDSQHKGYNRPAGNAHPQGDREPRSAFKPEYRGSERTSLNRESKGRDSERKDSFGPPRGNQGRTGQDNGPVRKDGPNKGPFGYMEFNTGNKYAPRGQERGREGDARGHDPKDKPRAKDSALVRLNRFIAQAGISSRREADELIAAGRVSVNGKVVTELGSKARRTDSITLDGKPLRTEKLVYILLNKPKGFITTTSDERGRRTVMELVGKAVTERIYPVGRLDKDTLGLLLFTNDGELTDRLTHPSHGARKVYHVFLDRPFVPEDFERLMNGIELEDGEFKPDGLQYVTASDGSEVGIELHSGRNRIVRRTFEYLGYTIEKLDRVIFAGITKKDLPRGRWRQLNDREVGMLKMNR